MTTDAQGACPLDSEAARAALDRVLTSRAFAKTARLSSFLRHVWTAQAEGRSADLTEQRIGQQLFGRAGQYNPAEDTIVRTTARLLRQRLATHYGDEGAGDAWRITIPRGAYVPVLQTACAWTAAADDSPHEPAVAASVGRARSWIRGRSFAWATGRRRRLAYLGVGMGLAVASGLGASTNIAPPRTGSTALWSEVFAADRDTLLVPADSNLVFYQLEVQRQLSLDDYIAKRVEPDPRRADVKFLRNRQSSISSVATAAELGKRAAATPERFRVRYARDLQLGEAKRSNLILLGVRQSNPWVELFRSRVNFHIDWDIATEKFLVRNDRPQPGESALYEFSKDDPDKRGYAQIVYTRGLDGAGRALLVAGTTAGAAEAVEEFVLDAQRMDPIVQKAIAADGRLQDFEILLQCVLRAGGGTDMRVVGVRIGRT